MSSFNWPPSGGSGNGIATYATFSDFPPTASDGTAAIALDTDTLYIYSQSDASWLAVGSPSTVFAVGVFGSTPNADGASISGNTLTLEPADGTHPGGLSTTTQTIAGQKTFSTGLTGTLTGHATSDVATSSLGTVTETTSSVLTLSGWTDATVGSPTITVNEATTSQSGYLSSTDWNTFNNKQPAGSYITGLTGDGTASGPGSVPLTLASVNGSPGTWGSNSAIPSFTVNGKGLITAASGINPTTTPTSGHFAGWDANSNLSANNLIVGYTTTATAAGTTTLNASSSEIQLFTGTTTQICKLPLTSGLVLGQQFTIINTSTGAVTVESSGANTVQVLASNSQVVVTVVSTSLTTAAAWNVSYTFLESTIGISALTGDVTASGSGSVAASLTATTNSTLATLSALSLPTSQLSGQLTLGQLPTMAANTVLANATGSSNTPTAVSLVSTATASAAMIRDTNANVQANNFITGYTTVATAAGTTALSASSSEIYLFTGTTTQTVTLPSTSTLVLGESFTIINTSTGAVTVQSSGSNTVQVLSPNTQAVITCVSTSVNTAAAWNASYTFLASVNSSVTNISTKTSSYTLQVNVDNTVIFDVSSGGLTATLPTAVGNSGVVFTIKVLDATSTSANTLTIATTSSQTIDGVTASQFNMAASGDYIQIQSNGTNWVVLDIQQTISFRYESSSTSCPDGSTVTVTFATKQWDTHSGFSGTTYTAPRAGRYAVSVLCQIQSTSGAGTNFEIVLQHNGGTYVQSNMSCGNTSSSYYTNHFHATVQMAQGDTLDVTYYQNMVGGSISLNANSFFEATRISN